MSQVDSKDVQAFLAVKEAAAKDVMYPVIVYCFCLLFATGTWPTKFSFKCFQIAAIGICGEARDGIKAMRKEDRDQAMQILAKIDLAFRKAIEWK